MGTTDDPGIDRTLLQSDQPSLRILGYTYRNQSFTYLEIVESVDIEDEDAARQYVKRLEQAGIVEENGTGEYKMRGERLEQPQQRQRSLEHLHSNLDEPPEVYDYIVEKLSGGSHDGEVAVPASHLDRMFPDEGWREDLSPFVMSGALEKRTYYEPEDLPAFATETKDMPVIVPEGRAGRLEEFPVEVYQIRERIYAEAVEELVSPEDGASPRSRPERSALQD